MQPLILRVSLLHPEYTVKKKRICFQDNSRFLFGQNKLYPSWEAQLNHHLAYTNILPKNTKPHWTLQYPLSLRLNAIKFVNHEFIDVKSSRVSELFFTFNFISIPAITFRTSSTQQYHWRNVAINVRILVL